MPSRLWFLILGATAACVLGACQPGSDVDWEVDERMPTAVHVRWTDGVPGAASVRYGPADGRWERETPLQSASGTVHEVTVVGLPAGEVHQLVPHVTTASGGVRTGTPLEVSIPEAPLAHLLASGVPDDGFVLTHTLSLGFQDVVAILDREGSVVWYSTPTRQGDGVLSAKLDEDGGSVWYAAHSTTELGATGTVFHVALDGSFEEIHEVDRLHSGVVPLEEGGFAYLKKLDQPWQDGLLLWDEIWEVLPTGEQLRVFSPLDHFEPEILCEHQMFEHSGEGLVYDWTHANSLLLSEDGSAYYLMLRHFDAILKVDRATGALEWVLGGPYGEFSFDDDHHRFDHAHMSQQTAAGFVVFDNGNHRSPHQSRVMSYVVDEDARTVSADWQYEHPDHAFNSMLGDAKRLPDGHTLISWTEQGLLQEVTAEGEQVWQANTPIGLATGRVSLVETLYPSLSSD